MVVRPAPFAAVVYRPCLPYTSLFWEIFFPLLVHEPPDAKAGVVVRHVLSHGHLADHRGRLVQLLHHGVVSRVDSRTLLGSGSTPGLPRGGKVQLRRFARLHADDAELLDFAARLGPFGADGIDLHLARLQGWRLEERPSGRTGDLFLLDPHLGTGRGDDANRAGRPSVANGTGRSGKEALAGTRAGAGRISGAGFGPAGRRGSTISGGTASGRISMGRPSGPGTETKGVSGLGKTATVIGLA